MPVGIPASSMLLRLSVHDLKLRTPLQPEEQQMQPRARVVHTATDPKDTNCPMLELSEVAALVAICGRSCTATFGASAALCSTPTSSANSKHQAGFAGRIFCGAYRAHLRLSQEMKGKDSWDLAQRVECFPFCLGLRYLKVYVWCQAPAEVPPPAPHPISPLAP